MQQSCKTCYFFLPTDKKRKIGFCHCEPPKFRYDPDDDDCLRGHWPAVTSSEWCGEYLHVKSQAAQRELVG